MSRRQSNQYRRLKFNFHSHDEPLRQCRCSRHSGPRLMADYPRRCGSGPEAQSEHHRPSLWSASRHPRQGPTRNLAPRRALTSHEQGSLAVVADSSLPALLTAASCSVYASWNQRHNAKCTVLIEQVPGCGIMLQLHGGACYHRSQ